jgi:transposase
MKGPEAVGVRRQAEEGCRWPSHRGSCPTSRQLDEWQRAGVWEKLHALLLAELTAAGELAT